MTLSACSVSRQGGLFSHRTTPLRNALWLAMAVVLPWPAAAAFTPLVPLPAPRITSSAQEYPGGQHRAQNMLDAKPGSEYSSDNKGTNTFIEFEFPAPVSLRGFRHLDRNDPATVAASELTLMDAAGKAIATVPVKHVNTRGGETFVGHSPGGARPKGPLAHHHFGCATRHGRWSRDRVLCRR